MNYIELIKIIVVGIIILMIWWEGKENSAEIKKIKEEMEKLKNDIKSKGVL
jgi:uncharacterized membrane-anchored protein YhcB (DUF1043 family)